MRLLVKWKKFKTQIKEYIKEADNLLLIERSYIHETDYDDILLQTNAWIYKCHSYLKNSFDAINNEFAQSFYSSKPYGSYIKTENKETRQKIADVFEELNTKRKTLEYTLRVLSVCDAIIQPDFVDLRTRAAYSKEEVFDLILDKLYHLYDNFYYPVQALLRGNGVKIGSPDELIDMVKTLEKKGYIRAIYSRVIAVQLNLNGKNLVEDRRRFNLIDTGIFVKSYIEIDSKISELSEDINQVGLGKELLIRELNDLKSLYNKLNKKNWAELLRGKLVDLESAQVINKEAMKKIYHKMTNEDLKII